MVHIGVTEGIGEIIAVEFYALVRLGVTMVVYGDEGGEPRSSFMKNLREANNCWSFRHGIYAFICLNNASL